MRPLAAVLAVVVLVLAGCGQIKDEGVCALHPNSAACASDRREDRAAKARWRTAEELADRNSKLRRSLRAAEERQQVWRETWRQP